jgi:FHS family Na+ dependent glucose MFS transporter 1
MVATSPAQPTLHTPDKSAAQTASYFAAFVALGLTTAASGPTLQGLAKNTHTSLSQFSFIFTALSLGYLLGSLGGGKLYDRLPGHKVMAAMLVIIAAMMMFVPLMPALWSLSGVLLVLGVAEGLLDVGGNTLLVWVHGSRVGPFMNGLHFFFGVGALVAPIVVAQSLLLTDRLIAPYWLLGLLVLPVAVWLVRLPSPSPQAASNAHAAEPTPYKLVALIAAFLFLYVGAEVGFFGWIYSYAIARHLGSQAAAAYLTSAFWGALTLGRLLAIPLTARFRPRVILFTDLLGCVVSLAVMLVWPHSLAIVWAGTLGIGLSMASIFPTILAMAERRIRITGQITGWFLVGASAGAMSLPWLIGQMFETGGPQILMVVMLAALALAGVVFAAIHAHQPQPATSNKTREPLSQ